MNCDKADEECSLNMILLIMHSVVCLLGFLIESDPKVFSSGHLSISHLVIIFEQKYKVFAIESESRSPPRAAANDHNCEDSNSRLIFK
jgi:hypothetical protein